MKWNPFNAWTGVRSFWDNICVHERGYFLLQLPHLMYLLSLHGSRDTIWKQTKSEIPSMLELVCAGSGKTSGFLFGLSAPSPNRINIYILQKHMPYVTIVQEVCNCQNCQKFSILNCQNLAKIFKNVKTLKNCPKLSKCWSGHVSSSLWSNVSKVTSL